MTKSPPGGVRGCGRDHWLTAGTHVFRCPWCQKKKALTHVELYCTNGFDATRRAYHVTYPFPTTGTDHALIVLVSHVGCGPDTGYAIPLPELVADPNRWLHHLMTKNWYQPAIEDCLEDVFSVHKFRQAAQAFTPRQVRKAVYAENQRVKAIVGMSPNHD